VNLVASGYTEAELDAQGLVVVFGGRVRALAENPVDRGQIQVKFLDGTGAEIVGTGVTAQSTNPTDRWDLVGDRVQIPVGTRQVVFRFIADRDYGTTNDSYLDHAFLYVVDETVAPNQGFTVTRLWNPQALNTPGLRIS